ncbi:MAG: PLP-dependent transferase [Candidatus Hydrogenedentes bacterium]|nr:PLP-dependent transferase [Candidatus Hydrogenedentota bacterium]
MRFKTQCIHAGQEPDPLHGAVMTPVYQTSTFAFKSADEPREFDYSRSGNPTRKALEECLAALEHGVRGFAFASGMAAESTLMMLYSSGDHVIMSDQVYGGTYRLMMNVIRSKGIDVDLVDLNDLDAIRGAIRPNTKLIWIETPTNPLMKVVDLAALAALARERGIQTICDNTFLSPYFQNPLDFGMDIVVHSTTKYLNGHSDVVGGAAVVSDPELGERVYYLQNAVGAVPGPWDCFLVLRGIKTLALRMEEHQKNGLAVARWLEDHPQVERVLHPGLESHPQHALAQRQSRGNSSTFSFYLHGGVKAAHALLNGLRLFSQAVSLGGVESLIEYPWTMTHAALPEGARREMGIAENLVRISVGLEDVADLVEDLEQALAGCTA